MNATTTGHAIACKLLQSGKHKATVYELRDDDGHRPLRSFEAIEQKLALDAALSWCAERGLSLD